MDTRLLGEYIAQCRHIVFFGGAGVSTESGIPDFRSVDGLYNQQYKYPPETILSHSFFIRYPDEFYQYYRDKMLAPDAAPNRAHKALALLERQGKLDAVITQNIDGLHQLAGSKHVLELHGSVHRYFCMSCGGEYGMEAVLADVPVPLCQCGGIIRPDVVLYEESLDGKCMGAAISAIQAADMLIIGGTSLAVYPAAGLVRYYKGDRLVLINKTPTPMDDSCNLVIQGSVGEALGAVVDSQ